LHEAARYSASTLTVAAADASEWSYWYGGDPLANKSCSVRNEVVGPFGFAGGQLYFVSRPAVQLVLSSDAVRAEAEVATSRRYGGDEPWEDVFVGYAISTAEPQRRRNRKLAPLVHMVDISKGGFSIEVGQMGVWGGAFVLHMNEAKRPEDLHTVHRWLMRDDCSKPENMRHTLACSERYQGVMCNGVRWQACGTVRDPDSDCPRNGQIERLDTPWAERQENGSCAWRVLRKEKHRALVGAPPPETSLRGAAGFCEATDFGGDCEKGESGAWEMDASLSTCVDMCSCCSRCRYVSFSAVNRDCSWHSECSMDSLQLMPGVPEAHGDSYVTVEVAKRTLKAVTGETSR